MSETIYLIVKGVNGEQSTSTFVAFRKMWKAEEYCKEMNDNAKDDIEYGHHQVHIED